MVKENKLINFVQLGFAFVSAFWSASLIIKLDFAGWINLVLFFGTCLNFAWTPSLWAGRLVDRIIAARLWLFGHVTWFGLFAYSIFSDFYVIPSSAFVKLFGAVVYGIAYFFVVDSFFKQERAK